ncbi:protein kinase domain-containing protein [Actinomadura rugatobispora]|uniref:Protein kinase n=1 Tax=Actinomadura rugatobispora TaxID=1994 RepID=A0ABW1AAQ0_9ACTN|nr:hypothetical protein GCM10010200_067230 [Actinomadura rugatobispora]
MRAEWREGDRILDLYEVRGVQGRGGMGVVHRVRHLGWDIDLAVKSPRPELFGSEEARKNFVREAETWVGLGMHPHVCACHYVRTIDEMPRVFAEYVNGGSLRRWIEDGRLYEGDALARVLDVAIQMAWGLEHAHAQGLVHQDVKPANVLLEADGTAKITDFGLARIRSPAAGTAAAAGGASVPVTVCGMTPAYASPEQAAGDAIGRRSDVWSFAVSLLEMFTGEITWLVGAAAGEALTGSAARRLTIPSSVAEILAHCLRPDAAERPASMAEVAALLVRAYERETGGGYRRPEPTAAQPRADELNNHALSLLDLGRKDEAASVFQDTLALDPHHLEATYNFGLLRWRDGAMRDDELVADLEAAAAAAKDPVEARRLLALVHLERDDAASARSLLQEAAAHSPGDSRIQDTLDLAGPAEEHGVVVDRRSRLLRRPRRDRYVSGPTSGGRDLSATPGEWFYAAQVALNADGTRALCWGWHGIGLWDVAAGSLLHPLDTTGFRHLMHHGDSMMMSLDDAGDRALFSTGYTDVHVWDVVSGQHLRTLNHPCERFVLHADRLANRLRSSAISGDGRLAITAAQKSHGAQVWETSSGRRLHVLKAGPQENGKEGEVVSVALNADGRIAACGSDHGEIKIWDLETGRCLRTRRGTRSIFGGVTRLCLSGDGTIVLAVSRKAVLAWDLATGGPPRTLIELSSEAASISLSGDGETALVVGGTPGDPVRLWHVPTGRCVRTVKGIGWNPRGALSGDGRIVALQSRVPGSGVQVMPAKVWSVSKAPHTCAYRLCRPRPHAELARLASRVERLVGEATRAAAQGRHQAALDLLAQARQVPGYERAPEVLRLWRSLTRSSTRTAIKHVWPHKPPQDLHAHRFGVCLLGRGDTLLTMGSDDSQHWDLETGRHLNRARAGEHSIAWMASNAHGTLVLTGNNVGITLWDVATLSRVRALDTAESHHRTSLSMDADARLAAATRATGSITVWDLSTGRRLRDFTAVTEKGEPDLWDGGLLPTGHLSADGRTVLSGAHDGAVRLWDTASGTLVRDLEGHGERIRSVRLSDDGRLALSASQDGTIRVWDLETGHGTRVFDTSAHGTITLARFSPDGRFVFSTDRSERTIQIWDIATGECIRVIEGFRMPISTLEPSADGRFLLAANEFRELRLWEIDWDLEPAPAQP